jgi:V/A-type H+-transporting ATPase subunit A
MKAIMKWGDAAMDALKSGVPSSEIIKMQSKNELPKVKFEEDFNGTLNTVLAKMDKEFAALGGK